MGDTDRVNAIRLLPRVKGSWTGGHKFNVRGERINGNLRDFLITQTFIVYRLSNERLAEGVSRVQ